MKRRKSIRSKLVLLFTCTSLIALVVNLIMFLIINQVISQIDTVYVRSEERRVGKEC